MEDIKVESKALNNAKCNGSLTAMPLTESLKSADIRHLNGLHLPDKKVMLDEEASVDDKCTFHMLDSRKSQQLIDKSTNNLIDEFSTALALSLVHPSNHQSVQNERDGVPKPDKISLSKVENIPCSNQDEQTEIHYPKTQTTENSNCIVAVKYGIRYLKYESEGQMSAIMQLITKDLSEPYSIYTYRYFIHNWPHLCFLAMHESTYVGAIVCKLDLHKKVSRRGYIAMLAVDKSARRRNIGTNLVKMAIETMNKEGCDEVVLETEVTNKPALNLYENLGFVRDKRLFRYYLNGVDALRLKLWLR